MPAQLKDASVRHRNNKAPSRATLHAVDPETAEIPELRPRIIVKDGVDSEGEFWQKSIEVAWQPNTILWWDSVWLSPMRSEFTGPDIEGLQMLAVLVDIYWRNPNSHNHTEIRLSEQKFGLTPLDRRRLEWTIEDAEKAKAAGTARRNAAAPKGVAQKPTTSPLVDPRQHTA